LKWTGGFSSQKGVEDALDHRCDSHSYVVAGIIEWLHGGNGVNLRGFVRVSPLRTNNNRGMERRGKPRGIRIESGKETENYMMQPVLVIVMLIAAMGLIGCPPRYYDRDRHDHDRGHDYEQRDRDNDDREHRR
jgi:hypothetical protein